MDPESFSPAYSEQRFQFLEGEDSANEISIQLEKPSGLDQLRSVEEDSEFILNRLNATSQSIKLSESQRKLKREAKMERKDIANKDKIKAKKNSLKKGAFFTNNNTTDLLVQIQRQIDFYFSDQNLLYDEHLRHLLNQSKIVPIAEIIGFSRLAGLLAPIISIDEKIEVIRRSIERTLLTDGVKKPRSKIVMLSKDRNCVCRRVTFDKSGIKQDEIDLRSVYIQGFKGTTSAEQLSLFIQGQVGVQPVYVRVIHERKGNTGTQWMSLQSAQISYGFMVFASEHQAERTVMEMRNRVQNSINEAYEGHKGMKIMLKKQWLKLKSPFKNLMKDMLIFYEDSELFKGEEQEQFTIYHECAPSNPFARIRGVNPRISDLNLKQAIMHYQNPVEVSHTQGAEEAVVRFRTNKQAKLFLGKCGALKLFGETLQVEELKMDEAAELLRREKQKVIFFQKKKELQKQERESFKMKEMLSQVIKEDVEEG